MTAEIAFRSSFQRLKSDCPRVLKKGSKVSQNNVAREAGLDPSALKKSRFPELIYEIQEWIRLHPDHIPAIRNKDKIAKARRLSLKNKIEELTKQRDQAISLLVDADLQIMKLTDENRKLRETTENDNGFK